MVVRLLLVEDDPKLGPLLERLFEAEGYEVRLATDAARAIQSASLDFDIAVIDRMLPDGDGLDVCTQLRRNAFDGPILMLTARAETKDRVHALDFGADDYLTKPFEMEELLARLRALLRRGPRLATFDIGVLHIDMGRRTAFADGKLVPLTAREFDLLAFLAARADTVVSKLELVESVWAADEIVPNVVEVHMSRLRDKLGSNASLIQTIRGQGYRISIRRHDD